MSKLGFNSDVGDFISVSVSRWHDEVVTSCSITRIGGNVRVSCLFKFYTMAMASAYDFTRHCTGDDVDTQFKFYLPFQSSVKGIEMSLPSASKENSKSEWLYFLSQILKTQANLPQTNIIDLPY